MNQENDKFRQSWFKFLDPEELKSNLQTASLFITAWELLKDSIISYPRQFFSNTFKDGVWIPSQEYKTEVLSKHKKILIASYLWLMELNVINDNDIEIIKEIVDHRNDITHELPKYLSDSEFEINISLFRKIFELISKIDTWWIINVEVAINPDYDGEEINESDVLSGRMITLYLMLEIISGNDSYLQELRKKFNK